jgi:adenylyltransferase/sulfurtransferase
MLTDNEKSRYMRQMGIPFWGESGQEKLKNSTAFVAGAGGLGGPVLFYLAGAGIGTIKVCDHDSVDLSNLNRQILHTLGAVGMGKADSALERLRAFNPEINIIPVKEKITADSVDRLLSGSDIILDCLDNFEARLIINRYLISSGVPLVHAGIEGFSGQATFVHPPETACLACFMPKKDSGVKSNVVGATAGLLGSIQALEAIKYLLGMEAALKNRLLFVNGMEMSFETIKIGPGRGCAACGSIKR